MRKSTKLISILLALIMVFSLLPISALAAEQGEQNVMPSSPEVSPKLREAIGAVVGNAVDEIGGTVKNVGTVAVSVPGFFSSVGQFIDSFRISKGENDEQDVEVDIEEAGSSALGMLYFGSKIFESVSSLVDGFGIMGKLTGVLKNVVLIGDIFTRDDTNYYEGNTYSFGDDQYVAFVGNTAKFYKTNDGDMRFEASVTVKGGVATLKNSESGNKFTATFDGSTLEVTEIDGEGALDFFGSSYPASFLCEKVPTGVPVAPPPQDNLPE